MNLLYPKLNRRFLPRMLGIAIIGALIAGVYGIIHDQITYSISPEYFTKMKFGQFHYADFGFPIRVFVSEVGFLATWWVGFFSAWFLARIAVPAWPASTAIRKCAIGFSIILATALLAGIVGYLLGITHSHDYSYWEEMCDTLGIDDVPAFARTGIIHYASYTGGLIGLIAAIGYLFRQKSTLPAQIV